MRHFIKLLISDVNVFKSVSVLRVFISMRVVLGNSCQTAAYQY